MREKQVGGLKKASLGHRCTYVRIAFFILGRFPLTWRPRSARSPPRNEGNPDFYIGHLGQSPRRPKKNRFPSFLEGNLALLVGRILNLRFASSLFFLCHRHFVNLRQPPRAKNFPSGRSKSRRRSRLSSKPRNYTQRNFTSLELDYWCHRTTAPIDSKKKVR